MAFKLWHNRIKEAGRCVRKSKNTHLIVYLFRHFFGQMVILCFQAWPLCSAFNGNLRINFRGNFSTLGNRFKAFPCFGITIQCVTEYLSAKDAIFTYSTMKIIDFPKKKAGEVRLDRLGG